MGRPNKLHCRAARLNCGSAACATPTTLSCGDSRQGVLRNQALSLRIDEKGIAALSQRSFDLGPRRPVGGDASTKVVKTGSPFRRIMRSQHSLWWKNRFNTGRCCEGIRVKSGPVHESDVEVREVSGDLSKMHWGPRG